MNQRKFSKKTKQGRILKKIRDVLNFTQFVICEKIEISENIKISQSAWANYEVMRRELPIYLAKKIVKFAHDHKIEIKLEEFYEDDQDQEGL